MVKFIAKTIYDKLELPPWGTRRKPKDVAAFLSRHGLLGQIRNNDLTHRLKGVFSREQGDSGAQQSIAKASYMANRYQGQWAAHGRYLAREGAQKAGERGVGFNATEDEIKLSVTLKDWQEAGDPRLWKIILSPEMGHKIELKDHVRAVMAKVEQDRGVKLEWVAIDHYNTDNHHAHIVIRGVDKVGEELKFSRTYLKEGFRLRSRQEATRVLGPRLKQEILEKRQAVVEKMYVTEIDREIVRNMDASSQVITVEPRGKDSYSKEKQSQTIARLQFLETLNLAQRTDIYSWTVNPNLLEHLRNVQVQNDIVKTMGQKKGKFRDLDLPGQMTTLPKVGDKVLGRLVDMGVVESQEDSRYLLVEGVDKKVHYMFSTPAINKLRDQGDLKNGDVIYLERQEMLKTEPAIVTKGMLAAAGVEPAQVMDVMASNKLAALDEQGRMVVSVDKATLTEGLNKACPAEASKVFDCIERACTVKYLKVASCENFTDIQGLREVHAIDGYILDMVDKSQRLPVRQEDDTFVRKELMEIIPERVRYLQSIRAIKPDNKVDWDVYNRELKQVRRQGLSRRMGP